MKVKELDSGVYGTGKEIIYVNGKYYLLSYNPAKVCVSEDLQNWTEYQLNEDYLYPEHIAYGNGLFVIVGSAGNLKKSYIYYSNDGITWKPKLYDTGYGFGLTFVKFINNRFVFGYSVAGYSMYDPDVLRTFFYIYETKDCVSFTHNYIKSSKTIGTYNVLGSYNMTDITYHDGLYVISADGGSIITTVNFQKFTRIQTEAKELLTGISYGKSQYIAVGDGGIILTSTDGKTWMKQNSGCTSYLKRTMYSNGMYIVVGYNGTILQSIDGITWNNISNKQSGLRYGLCVADNRFVISATYYTNTHTIPIFYFDVSRNLIAEGEEDSSLFFFDKEFNLIGIVDFFISLRWRRKYFEAGEFEIVLPVNEYINNLIDKDVLVMRNNYTEAGIIETIEYSDNGTNEEVTISGRFLSSILERRIVKSKINFSGNTIEGMNTILDSMTPISNQWEIEPVTMSSPHINFQCTYKNIYDYLCKLSKYSNIGFRVVPNVDSKVYMFEVWKGLDRTVNQNENEQYSFSDDNYNIEQGSLIISDKTKVNYVLVGGKGEDDNRVIVEVDEGASGFDRYEIFNDQKSLSDNGLSSSEYQSQLRTAGESKLSDGTFKLEVTALVQQDYKTKWDLGDVVNIKKEKWGVYTTYRVIEVEEIIEDGKKTIFPSFGSPLPSEWSDK